MVKLVSISDDDCAVEKKAVADVSADYRTREGTVIEEGGRETLAVSHCL
jgi:hypothetical protein